MTAQTADTETFEEEYEEYDEFDDDGEERGLSGLVVLLMGVVMLGAFASVVWIAYQQGIKTGDEARGETPYVAADPEPLKIENDTGDTAAAANERSVYDRFDGEAGDNVEVLAEGPEEPVDRTADDPIAAIASANTDAPPVEDDAVADRIASLAAADKEMAAEAAAAKTETVPPPPAKTAAAVSQPKETPAPSTPKPKTTPAASQPAASAPAARASGAGALSGTHLVQVGAFGSDSEAQSMWKRMEGKLGDYLNGKSSDVERADLGAKGVFYRLRVGPFASSDAAKTYCEGLKSRGQDCLVKPK